MASSSSSSSSVEQKYQVFLSFRGEDTRYTFTSHLHAALEQKGIDAFIDNELRRGEEISQALLTAIQESKIYVIILSKNYASSSWCLKELCEILECKKRNEQKVVVPIFYHVDPSDVRNQTGKRFEEAFAKHQEKRSHEVGKWKAALTEVGNLSGHHIEKNVRPEPEHIEEIVEGILKEFVCTSSCDTKGLFGIESRIKEIESMLCFDSPHVNVLVVGIWGMGGIGKTTIANAVFERFRTQFEGWCFLENVKEKYKGVRSREFLFSEILGGRNAGPSSLPACIEDRLRHKRVLIVLDDVDESRQLDLLPKKDCFGRGSRIIVTSRDKQVFKSRVDVIYTVEELDDYEALQLFRFHAFKQSYPEEDFMKLSKEVVQFVKGLPLALRVLGSALYCKSKSFWVDALKKLKEIPNRTIVDTLKISFDALDDEVRHIFLDIACFFKVILTFEEMNRYYITNILDGVYESPMSGIDTLIDKSLVTTSYNRLDMLDMHDLVQQMGKAIVCQEHKEPGQRSRLWNPKEICHVLKNKAGTGSVTSMLVDMSEIGEVRLGRKAFKGMKNLRYLKLYYYDYDSRKDRNGFIFEQGLKYFPETLRYLYWDSCPLKSLPLKFSPENLVELCLPNSHVVGKLWNDVQNLVNLKRLDLFRSRKLIEIPDLSRATSLEVLILEGCSSLVEVHSSIRNLNNLRQLLLAGGHRHIDHTRSLHNFKCVHCQVIYYGGCCPKITKFPEIPESNVDLCLSGIAIVPWSIGCLPRLRYLCPSYWTRFKRLPRHIDHTRLLHDFECVHCQVIYYGGCYPKITKFPEIPESIVDLCLSGTAIDEVPSSIGCLPRLGYLCLSNCTRLKRLPSSICKLKSLEHLDLSGCLELESFPEILETMKNLNYLYLNETSIEELPSSIEHLVGLRSLHLTGCKKLKTFPSTIWKLQSLVDLSLEGCLKLVSLPEISETMKNLECLFLNRTSIGELPSSIEHLVGLKSLMLRGCEKLKSLPTTIGKLCSLACLSLDYCSNITKFPEFLEIPWNLKRLGLGGTAIEQVPSSIMYQPNLEVLNLENCTNLSCSLPRCIFEMTRLAVYGSVLVSGVSKLEVIQEHLRTVTRVKFSPYRSAETGNMKCDLFWSRVHVSLNLSSNDFRRLGMTLGVFDSSVFEELPDNLEKFKYLRELSLSFCNLSAISSGFTCISSLRKLDLSENNFETVPESFNQLLQLEELCLRGCKRLRSLPELPPRLGDLNANHCTSLETVSGAFPISDLLLSEQFCYSSQKFCFTNCTNLDHKAIWAKTQMCIQQMATEDVNLYRSNKQMTTEDVNCYHSSKWKFLDSSFHIGFPGSEIPEWFDSQSPGSCVSTLLPRDLQNDHKFVGFALCVVVAAFNDARTSVGLQCRSNFKTTGDGCHSIPYHFYHFDPWKTNSDHVYIVYYFNLYGDWDSGESHYHLNEAFFEFFVYEDGGEHKYSSLVKNCGVCLLYAEEDTVCRTRFRGVPTHRPSVKVFENGGRFWGVQSESDAGECAVNNQDFVEPMVEDATTSKRPRDDYCYDEAEPSKNFSSDEVENPHAKRLKN